MTNPEIVVVAPSDFELSAASYIADVIRQAVKKNGRALVALSGGSTPAGIYRQLAQQDLPWNVVHLFLGDERWVPSTNAQSNARMVRESLLATARSGQAHFYPASTELESAALGAQHYAGITFSVCGTPPRFDLVLLGVGDDGHTASIFPGSPLINKSKEICAEAKNPHNGTIRITYTRTVLESAACAMFLAKGQAKATMLRRVLEGNESEQVLPSRMYRTFQGNVVFFLDALAATELAPK